MEVGQEMCPSYYSILGVSSESSIEDIKRAYRRLAMQWHPDRWTKTPSLLGNAKRKFQQIQEAYSVLSDQRKRTLYDAGLYDIDDEEDEGFSDFLQEILSLMAKDRKEEKKSYSMEELQSMFMEMAQGFESSWYYGPPIVNDSGPSKRARCDSNGMMSSNGSHFSVSGWGMYETSSY
ncbi:hypothetical protein Tsubulata_013298 [Turnera subulata]|uniref:J domain-containing protein n=1 Tax=Turnera subulata TaxID=218843 RepID=A0A9Q0G4H3_9ROSI|nr:hypothetical protein Tsubulata_013298 [Turnera subulata]